jgi:hypothetical protein
MIAELTRTALSTVQWGSRCPLLLLQLLPLLPIPHPGVKENQSTAATAGIGMAAVKDFR